MLWGASRSWFGVQCCRVPGLGITGVGDARIRAFGVEA